MLILTRNVGEAVIIGEGEDQVEMQVVGIQGKQVRLAFNAPRDVAIDREEIRQQKLSENS